jgi:hypothetical protein
MFPSVPSSDPTVAFPVRVPLDELVQKLVEVLAALRAMDVIGIGGRWDAAPRTVPSTTPVQRPGQGFAAARDEDLGQLVVQET